MYRLYQDVQDKGGYDVPSPAAASRKGLSLCHLWQIGLREGHAQPHEETLCREVPPKGQGICGQNQKEANTICLFLQATRKEEGPGKEEE